MQLIPGTAAGRNCQAFSRRGRSRGRIPKSVHERIGREVLEQLPALLLVGEEVHALAVVAALDAPLRQPEERQVHLPGLRAVSGVLWVYGSGGWRFFPSLGGNRYLSPPDDFGTLVKNLDGSWT